MTHIKLTEDIWFYKNVHPNISELLKNIEGQNNWWNYTNGLNPDGTECHSGIRGSATSLWPDTNNYSEVINIFKNVFEDYIMFKIFWLTGAPLWRKSFLLNENLSFNEKLHQAQDYDFHMRVLAISENYFPIKDYLVIFKVHNEVFNQLTLEEV